MEAYWYFVVFHNGKRVEKRIRRTRENTDKLKAKHKELTAKGIKCHIVGRTPTSEYPPTAEILDERAAGHMWCPYCRAWRFFTIPKFKPHAEIGTEPWFDNTNFRQGIKRCNWCHVNEMDWWVCRANGTFAEARATKRKRRGRRVRR